VCVHSEKAIAKERGLWRNQPTDTLLSDFQNSEKSTFNHSPVCGALFLSNEEGKTRGYNISKGDTKKPHSITFIA
jgi:hypothetical protein